MKIIDKNKDYYDYIAGFDTDPRKIYIRENKKELVSDIKSTNTLFPHGLIDSQIILDKDMKPTYYLGSVYFCDERYPYLHDIEENKYYYEYDKIPTNISEKLHKLTIIHQNSYRITIYLDDHFEIVKGKLTRWDKERFNKRKEARKNINKRLKCPIIFTEYKNGLSYIIRNGILEDIQFGKIKTPQDAFTELYNWIEYPEPLMPSSPDDIQRFEGKGFDKRSSFRNIK